MKYLALALVALVAISYFNVSQTPSLQLADNTSSDYQKYVQWKAKYGKNTNGAQDELRFQIFQENMRLVESDSESLELTQFADLANFEFKQMYTSKITEAPQGSMKVESAQQAENLWGNVNWVQEGAVTSVKDQGQCGACWAFAAVAGMEGVRAINEGTLQSLSNQQVNSCTTYIIFGGCLGGNSALGITYTYNHGLVPESQYPYTSGTSGKTEKCNLELTKNPVFNNVAPQSKQLPPGNVNLYNSVAQQPTILSVDAGSIYFQLYKPGSVLKNKGCGIELNHAVTAVGYDSSDSAWVVKNSWGVTWGDKGYLKIYNDQNDNNESDGICGVNMQNQVPVYQKRS